MVRFGIISTVAGLAFSACSSDVRPPAVAGSFYERSPFALDRQVVELLDHAACPAVTGKLVAAVAPHAGYDYSGKVSAAVYSLLSSGMVDRVIILGPAHYGYVRGVSVPDPALKYYETPLGKIPIDRAVCVSLAGKPGFVTEPDAAIREHSLEVQLPFLQKKMGAFRLVPLICGPESGVDVEAVSSALAALMDGKTLMIASSDFTHYGPNYRFVPFGSPPQVHLQKWLKESSACIAALDESGFQKHCSETQDTICGETAIRILMATLRKADIRDLSGRVLDVAMSGDVTGDFRNSVSYAAIGFFVGKEPVTAKSETQAGKKEYRAMKEHKSGTWTPGLSDEEKTTLFSVARDTLKWCVEGGKGKFDFKKYTLTPLLKTDMATFVTLKIRGSLRGCIGSLAPMDPLYLSVHENAVNAALRDPRFPPVQPDELSRISVDVSVLSPIRDIPSLDDFKIGQMGIILEKGRYRAVYLPEVATEQGWTIEETLSSLSMKAGLPPNAWREGAKFKVFESVVLSE